MKTDRAPRTGEIPELRKRKLMVPPRKRQRARKTLARGENHQRKFIAFIWLGRVVLVVMVADAAFYLPPLLEIRSFSNLLFIDSFPDNHSGFGAFLV